VADFGLAKRLGDRRMLTGPGALLGTPSYLSPEQARGAATVGPASDVYGLGATLYEMLTGRPPFRAATAVETLRQVLDEEPVPPRRLNPAIARDLGTICLKCLQKVPARRYAGAADLADDVARYRAGMPIHARPAGAWERGVKWARRRPAPAALVLLLLLSVPAALAGLAWLDRRDRAARVDNLVELLLTTETDKVPPVVEELHRHRSVAETRLRDLWAASPPESPARLRAALALLPLEGDDPTSEVAAFLGERLFVADPMELLVIRDALRRRSAALVPRLWEVVRDLDVDPGRRFRAACALADYSPDPDRWEDIRQEIAARLVEEDPLLVRGWTELLRPVGPELTGPLLAMYRDRSQPERGHLAAAVLAEYCAADLAALADLIGEADPVQFRYLMPKLQTAPAEALALLLQRSAAGPPAGATGAENEAWCRRRANLAVATLRLGASEGWVLFSLPPGADPLLRSHLLHRLGPMGVDHRAVAERLTGGAPDSARRALLLALGEYREDQFPKSWKDGQARRLLELYRSDPDPGIHSACEWVLRRWGYNEATLFALARAAAGGGPAGGRRWYVTAQGHTMAAFPCPAPGLLGSPDTEPLRRADEPLRPYRPRPFAIATKETTAAQFRQFRPTHPQAASDKPVTFVDYRDAARYCNRLSEQEGIPRGQWCYEEPGGPGAAITAARDHRSRAGYRLPTEEEWEYSCRAGAAARYFFGDSEELLPFYDWFRDKARISPAPVGRLKPNDFGLFDTPGNATEWCSHARGRGELGQQVLRGGSVRYMAGYIRAANRIEIIVSHKDETVGFRVARTLPPGAAVARK
jgi:formylglycine-generating enzyme required for sulfatase activity